MEHVQARLRTGMRESEVAAMWNSWVHDHGTGWGGGKVELAHGFSLVWTGAGIRTFTATGSTLTSGARVCTAAVPMRRMNGTPMLWPPCPVMRAR